MSHRRLPVKQLVILCKNYSSPPKIRKIHANVPPPSAICRFAEPIALTSVFPYLPEMIESFGVPKNDIARWAGLTSAIFSLCQSLTGMPWGTASDRYGRKPIILIGLINTMVTMLLWGFSTSLPMAIVVRALQGLGNGNIGILRTTVAELCPWKVSIVVNHEVEIKYLLGVGAATTRLQYHAARLYNWGYHWTSKTHSKSTEGRSG